MSRIVKVMSAVLALTVILICLQFAAYSADATFENAIADFPASYKVSLRELHEKYPKWTFEALDTGLDWNTVIAAESSGNRNLVPGSSTYSDIFKSMAAGDYNPSTGQYIVKDSGFVTGNEMAVSYFMDPRNSLTASTVFQFESLMFASSCTIDTIENVLYGSFMYNTYIRYYDTNGKYITTNQKYSEVIYEAGKTYNINPTYLASKILNEVGYSGSSSVSGTYSGYPGIYNFYNIGATDGSGAIGRGLSWASSGSTYLRPWDTPYKSILGGAKFLADNYIAQGQYNGYLQKFQVNPNSSYGLYQHQYMTNVAGADTQGYTTYLSYLGNGTLALPRHFVIPVFKNMPGQKITSTGACLTETIGQLGTVTSSCNIRTGPSTSYSKLDFMIPSGTAVSVIEKTLTDASYYLNVLKYPYWCKVSFKYNGSTYSGYIVADYLNITTKSVYSVGTYTLTPRIRPVASDDKMTVLSSDSSVARTDGNTVTFLKQGYVTLTAYSSCGGYDVLSVAVNNTAAASRAVSGVSAVSYTNAVRVSWNKAASATGYNVCIFDSSMNEIKSVYTADNTCIISSLPSGKPYYVDVRSYLNSSSLRYFSAFSGENVRFATRPPQVTGCKAAMRDGKVLLNWDSLSGVTGYTVFRYENGKYTAVASTTKNSYTVSGIELTEAERYYIRAYVKFGSNFYGALSESVKPDYSPIRVDRLTQTNTTTTGYTITWNKVEGAAGYCVYKAAVGGAFKLVARTAGNRYVVSSVSPASKLVFRVVSYNHTNGVYSYAEPSQNYTAASAPQRPSALSVKSKKQNSVTLKWNAVAGEVYYQLMSKRSDGAYVWYATTMKNEYTVNQIDSKLTLAVRAVVITDSVRFYSDCSNIVNLAFKVSAPTGFKCDSYSGGFTLSWANVSGADGYQLWRYDPDLGTYVYVTLSAKNSYSVFGIKPGEAYRYKIRAFMKLTTGTIYSEFSQVTASSAK